MFVRTKSRITRSRSHFVRHSGSQLTLLQGTQGEYSNGHRPQYAVQQLGHPPPTLPCSISVPNLTLVCPSWKNFPGKNDSMILLHASRPSASVACPGGGRDSIPCFVPRPPLGLSPLLLLLNKPTTSRPLVPAVAARTS